MKNARNYWSNHLAAINAQGISTSVYAKPHDISLASLYFWRSKLLSESTTPSSSLPTPVAAPKPQSKFVALRVRDAVPGTSAPIWCCTLVLTGGMRLEMSVLPDPQWLVGVDRANQVGY